MMKNYLMCLLLVWTSITNAQTYKANITNNTLFTLIIDSQITYLAKIQDNQFATPTPYNNNLTDNWVNITTLKKLLEEQPNSSFVTILKTGAKILDPYGGIILTLKEDTPATVFKSENNYFIVLVGHWCGLVDEDYVK